MLEFRIYVWVGSKSFWEMVSEKVSFVPLFLFEIASWPLGPFKGVDSFLTLRMFLVIFYREPSFELSSSYFSWKNVDLCSCICLRWLDCLIYVCQMGDFNVSKVIGPYALFWLTLVYGGEESFNFLQVCLFWMMSYI